MGLGRAGRVVCLFLIGAGVLLGCSRGPKALPADPLAGVLAAGPRSRALIFLRLHLPRVVTCPSTIELTENGVSWVDIHSCHPTDLRRRLRFKDIRAARLIWEKIHMGFDQRWLEVMHNNGWVPIGRGVAGPRGEKRMQNLEGVKTALERLSPGRETPHRWKAHARPFLF